MMTVACNCLFKAGRRCLQLTISLLLLACILKLPIFIASILLVTKDFFINKLFNFICAQGGLGIGL